MKSQYTWLYDLQEDTVHLIKKITRSHSTPWCLTIRKYSSYVAVYNNTWCHVLFDVMGYLMSWVIWCHRLFDVIGYLMSWVTWCHGLFDVMGYLMSWVIWCHGLFDVMGYLMSWVIWCHGLFDVMSYLMSCRGHRLHRNHRPSDSALYKLEST